MVRWYQGLYMDVATSKKPEKCMKRIEKVRLWKKSYTVIALPTNEDNLFDIINTREMFFKYHKRREIYILGVATDYDSAVDLLSFLLYDMQQQTGEFDPRTFFSKDKFVSRQNDS